MMRPIGLYLAEFRPDAPMGPSFSVGAGLTVLPDLQAESAFPALEAPDFDTMPAFPAEAFPAFDAPIEPDEGAESNEPAPDMAAVMALLREEHAAELAAARAQWVAEEGAALAERIGAAFAALETRLGDALAPLLEPFLAKAARAKALSQLHDTLGTLLGGGEARPVVVSGPADLVAALREIYGDRPGASFTESDLPDVTVTLGDTRIRSQLRGWARKLDSALGGQA